MKIAVGGSAANPPHFGHRELVSAVIGIRKFDQVRWTVSGDRPDKPGLPEARLRWEMGRMVMDRLEPLEVLYESGKAVPTIHVIADIRRSFADAEIVWYCGADHFLPREKFSGKCDILGFWDDGEYLFENQEFLIIPRKGLVMEALQFPKRFTILEADIPEISSTEIRRCIQAGERISHLTSEEVERYIRKKKLYRT